jgi:mono/diheme cytochrome c family protein
MKGARTIGRRTCGATSARCGGASVLAALALLNMALVGAAEPGAKLTARQEEGRKLYNGSCVYCHGPNVWGTFTLARRLGAEKGLLEKRTDLVGPYVKSVIRAGVGSMPAMRRTELSDAEVDAIVDYLTRKKGSP